MKLKSWMEAHIVLHTKWKKKDKRKKVGENKNHETHDPAATLPSSRTRSFLQFFVATNATTSKHSKTLPEPREKDKRQQIPQNFTPTDFTSNKIKRVAQNPPVIKDSHSSIEGTTPIHTLHVHLAEKFDNVNINSPRQRNKIRTNPWLTPKLQRSIPSSSSGLDCNSCIWEPPSNGTYRCMDSWKSSAESSCDSYPVEKYVKRAPDHINKESISVKSAFLPPLATDTEFRKLVSGKTENDSDSEECETLNEMGNFDEHYEYDCETVETDILGDSVEVGCHPCSRRRSSKRRARATMYPPPLLISVPCKWRDLRSDEDYSEKLEYADEAYSEISGSIEDETVLRNGFDSGLSDSDEKAKGERTPEADSAFPSESELSSLVTSTATTPLLEGEGSASSSGSDSGIQQHSGWPETNRSLRSIRDSLEDKVRHLRFERLIVEDKIREAKEEDSEKCLEKERFRKELVLHRRQVLLRTLNELRYKLEDQSVRLQEAYHSTLEMQLNSRRQLPTVMEENNVGLFNRIPMMHEKLL